MFTNITELYKNIDIEDVQDQSRRESIFQMSLSFERLLLNYSNHHLSELTPQIKVVSNNLCEYLCQLFLSTTSINHSVNQSIKQPINQSVNRLIKQASKRQAINSFSVSNSVSQNCVSLNPSVTQSVIDVSIIEFHPLTSSFINVIEFFKICILCTCIL